MGFFNKINFFSYFHWPFDLREVFFHVCVSHFPHGQVCVRTVLSWLVWWIFSAQFLHPLEGEAGSCFLFSSPSQLIIWASRTAGGSSLIQWWTPCCALPPWAVVGMRCVLKYFKCYRMAHCKWYRCGRKTSNSRLTHSFIGGVSRNALPVDIPLPFLDSRTLTKSINCITLNIDRNYNTAVPWHVAFW